MSAVCELVLLINDVLIDVPREKKVSLQTSYSIQFLDKVLIYY